MEEKKSITEEKIALKKVQKKISTKKAERKLLFQKEILFKIIRVCLKKKGTKNPLKFIQFFSRFKKTAIKFYILIR